MQTWFEVERSTSRPMLAQKGVASLRPQPGEHAKVERPRVTGFPSGPETGTMVSSSGLGTYCSRVVVVECSCPCVNEQRSEGLGGALRRTNVFHWLQANGLVLGIWCLVRDIILRRCEVIPKARWLL